MFFDSTDYGVYAEKQKHTYQTAKIMKKLVSIMVLGLFWVASSSFADLDPSVKITMYASVCPAIEAGQPVWNTYAGNVMSFLSGTGTESPVVDPANIHAVCYGKWGYVCVDPSGQTAMWLGQLTPGGIQRGNGISFPMKIVTTGALISLNDVRITVSSWDAANSLGRVQVLSSYYPEARGIKTDGTFLTSGPSTAPVKEIQYVGPRAAYAASNQGDLNAISNYVNSVAGFGISCLVEVLRDGNVVARRQLDIPFNPSRAVLTQLNSSTLLIGGITNRQYRLQWTESVSPPYWQNFGLYGLPVFGGEVDVSPVASDMRFFRVFQNP